MAATSFLASFTPKTKTFALSKPQTPLLPSSLSSFSSLSLPSSKRFKHLVSPFVRNVAVSSEYEKQEEILNEYEEVPNFSPDLKLFVGNLPFNVDGTELADLFGNAGTLQMVEVIHDKVTGRIRGFGFVTMSTVDEVEAAAQQFNGYEFEGRQLRVNSGPSPPRDSAPRSSRGGPNYANNTGFMWEIFHGRWMIQPLRLCFVNWGMYWKPK